MFSSERTASLIFRLIVSSMWPGDDDFNQVACAFLHQPVQFDVPRGATSTVAVMPATRRTPSGT